MSLVEREQGGSNAKKQQRCRNREDCVRPDRTRGELLICRRHVPLYDCLIGCIGRDVLCDRPNNDDPQCDLRAGDVPVKVGDREFGKGNYFIDDEQRTIPDHLHWHARPNDWVPNLEWIEKIRKERSPYM